MAEGGAYYTDTKVRVKYRISCSVFFYLIQMLNKGLTVGYGLQLSGKGAVVELMLAVSLMCLTRIMSIQDTADILYTGMMFQKQPQTPG